MSKNKEIKELQELIINLLADSTIPPQEKTLDGLTKKTDKHRNTVEYNLKKLKHYGVIDKNLLIIAPNRPVYYLTEFGLEVFHELDNFLKLETYKQIKDKDFIFVKNDHSSKIKLSEVFEILTQVKKQNPTFDKLTCVLMSHEIWNRMKLNHDQH